LSLISCCLLLLTNQPRNQTQTPCKNERTNSCSNSPPPAAPLWFFLRGPSVHTKNTCAEKKNTWPSFSTCSSVEPSVSLSPFLSSLPFSQRRGRGGGGGGGVRGAFTETGLNDALSERAVIVQLLLRAWLNESGMHDMLASAHQRPEIIRHLNSSPWLHTANVLHLLHA